MAIMTSQRHMLIAFFGGVFFLRPTRVTISSAILFEDIYSNTALPESINAVIINTDVAHQFRIAYILKLKHEKQKCTYQTIICFVE